MWVNSSFIPWYYLPLIHYLVFYFHLSILYFVAQSTKRPAHGKSSQSALGSQVARDITRSCRLCHYSLSACCGVLRNLICAAIQVNIYPHKSSNSLAQWPATVGASIVLFNGAGFLLKLPLQCMGILVSITFGYSVVNVRM